MHIVKKYNTEKIIQETVVPHSFYPIICIKALFCNFFFFFNIFFLSKFAYLFIYLYFMAVLGLRFCARAFSSCGKRGPLFIAVRGPLTIVASPVAEHRLQRAGSVIVAHGPSCSSACGIFPDQGLNPCPCIGRQTPNHCATREAQFLDLALLHRHIYTLASPPFIDSV